MDNISRTMSLVSQNKNRQSGITIWKKSAKHEIFTKLSKFMRKFICQN